MIQSNTPNTTVFAFPRSEYNEHEIQYLSYKQCDELFHNGKCDKIFVEEFLNHLNMDCIPTQSQFFILR